MSEALSEILISRKSRSSSRRTCRRALSTMAAAVAPPARARMSFSSDPELTPIRMGTPLSPAARTTSRTFSGEPMLPGLRRRPSTPASSAARARRWSKWMSAMSGTRARFRISRRAAAAARSGTARRTISAPAFSRRRTWASGRPDVPGVRLGHGLDDDRRAAADDDAADLDRDASSGAGTSAPPPA